MRIKLIRAMHKPPWLKFWSAVTAIASVVKEVMRRQQTRHSNFIFFYKYLAKRIIRWIMTTHFLPSLLRQAIDYAVMVGVKRDEIAVIARDDPERNRVFDLVIRIRRETDDIFQDNEAYQLFMSARNTCKVEGDIAEVGVYQGRTAKIICEAKGNKTLHLFDTFEGLPALSEFDEPKEFHKGQFAASLEAVQCYLSKYPNVYFYKGMFPGTSKPVENRQFCFISLDVDLFQSTLSCLDFFYPRMNRGGIIVSHDYMTRGVRKAVDEFFVDKPEVVIELPPNHCMIVKL